MRTIVPVEVARGMGINKCKGYGAGLRVARGETIPILGEIKLEGIGGKGGVKMTAQVAAIPKPLASAYEMTEWESGDNSQDWRNRQEAKQGS